MRIPRAAQAQAGIWTRRQARAEGISARVIRRRLADGVWMEFMPHAFHLVGVEPGPLGQLHAAVQLTGGVASHESAAWLHGLLDAAPPRPVVTTRRRLHVDLPAVVEHRLVLREGDCTTVRGVWATSRTVTMLDLLGALPLGDARSMLFRGVQQQWIDPPTLLHGISERPGRHGIQQLRALAELLGTGAHSYAESRAHDLLGQAGIAFHANVRITLATHTVIVDLLIDDVPLVVEIDGRRFHAEADVFQRDRSRQNALVAAGFTVLRFTMDDLVHRPEYVVNSIRHAMTRLRAAA